MSTIQGELVREAIFIAHDPLVEKQGREEKIEGATIRLEYSFHQHRGENNLHRSNWLLVSRKRLAPSLKAGGYPLM